ncbi:MAG: biotin/lipoyl-binding protein [Actinobacteria bacterium]|nr:biotin/lipoyl-binding protein [Actinomycetota bacterium]
MKRFSSKTALWMLIGILLIASFFYYFFIRQRALKTGEFETYTVKVQKIKPYISVSGDIYPKDAKKLYFTTSGEVKEVLVKPGDKVKKGQLLASIQSKDTGNSLKIAEINLNSAKTRYNQTKESYETQISQLEQKIKSIDSQLKKIDNQIASVKEEIKDLQDALPTTTGESPLKQISELTKTLTSLNNQKESLLNSKKEAESTLDSLKKRKKSDLLLASYQVEQAKLSYDQAIETQKGTSLYSPIDGVVLFVGYEVGEEIGQGSSSTSLSDSSYTQQISKLSSSLQNSSEDNFIVVAPEDWKPYARVVLDQIDVIKVKPGLKAEAFLDALPNLILKGKVESINYYPESGSSNSVSYSAIVTFENSDKNIVSGMSAIIRIFLDQIKSIAVPITSVRYINGVPFVYVKRNNKFVQQRVETGESDDRFTVIKSGLNNGDVIVKDVSEYLSNTSISNSGQSRPPFRSNTGPRPFRTFR